MDMISFLMGKAYGGSGGGSSVTVEALTATENKTYTAPEGKAYSPVTVNVPTGGGGLEYEEGTWTPSEDTHTGTILFVKQHTKAPLFWVVYDDGENATAVAQSMIMETYIDNGQLSPAGMPANVSTAERRYGAVARSHLTASSNTSNAILMASPSTDTHNNTDTSSHPRYWCDETSIKLHSYTDSQFFRTGRTYKWFAAWLPES